jgi:hypothetical protein
VDHTLDYAINGVGHNDVKWIGTSGITITCNTTGRAGASSIYTLNMVSPQAGDKVTLWYQNQSFISPAIIIGNPTTDLPAHRGRTRLKPFPIKHRLVLPSTGAYIDWFKCGSRIGQTHGLNFSTVPTIYHRERLFIGYIQDSSQAPPGFSSNLVAPKAIRDRLSSPLRRDSSRRSLGV